MLQYNTVLYACTYMELSMGYCSFRLCFDNSYRGWGHLRAVYGIHDPYDGYNMYILYIQHIHSSFFAQKVDLWSLITDQSRQSLISQVSIK